MLLLERKVAGVSRLPSGRADVLDGCENEVRLTLDQQHTDFHIESNYLPPGLVSSKISSTSSRGLLAVSGNMKKTWMNMAAQKVAKMA